MPLHLAPRDPNPGPRPGSTIGATAGSTESPAAPHLDTTAGRQPAPVQDLYSQSLQNWMEQHIGRLLSASPQALAAYQAPGIDPESVSASAHSHQLPEDLLTSMAKFQRLNVKFKINFEETPSGVSEVFLNIGAERFPLACVTPVLEVSFPTGPTMISAARADLAYTLANSANQHLQNNPVKGQTIVFAIIPDINFASTHWNSAEIQQGFRIAPCEIYAADTSGLTVVIPEINCPVPKEFRPAFAATEFAGTRPIMVELLCHQNWGKVGSSEEWGARFKSAARACMREHGTGPGLFGAGFPNQALMDLLCSQASGGIISAQPEISNEQRARMGMPTTEAARAKMEAQKLAGSKDNVEKAGEMRKELMSIQQALADLPLATDQRVVIMGFMAGARAALAKTDLSGAKTALGKIDLYEYPEVQSRITALLGA